MSEPREIRVVNLVMGDDDACVWCKDPKRFRLHGDLPPIPWSLCPTHFGLFHDDDELRKYTELKIPYTASRREANPRRSVKESRRR